MDEKQERPIYLDYNATTPVDPRVVEAMLPYFSTDFGNPSSSHAYGMRAHDAIEQARSQVADLIGAKPQEIVFTGGGSEADNLAIVGTVLRRLSDRPHVVASAIEHPAILNTLTYLRRRFDVDSTLVSPDDHGLIDPDAVRAVLRPNTALVTIMHANNEVGTVQPLAEIARAAHEAGALLHADGAQSAGKIAIDVETLGVDMLTLAAHKFYGPKGVGALFVRAGTLLDPVVHGSSQERGLRAGTENVPGMVGMGAAATLALDRAEDARLERQRDALWSFLQARVAGIERNGHPTRCLPNTLNVSFPDVGGSVVLSHTPGVAASTGSACHSAVPEPSAVLLAMGLSPERALGAVRLSLGRWTTDDEIARAAELLAGGWLEARAAGPQPTLVLDIAARS